MLERLNVLAQGSTTRSPAHLLTVQAAAPKPSMKAVQDRLLGLVRATRRGLHATKNEMAAIEEEAVCLESHNPSNVTVREALKNFTCSQ
jgi:hypothetical protein